MKPDTRNEKSLIDEMNDRADLRDRNVPDKGRPFMQASPNPDLRENPMDDILDGVRGAAVEELPLDVDEAMEITKKSGIFEKDDDDDDLVRLTILAFEHLSDLANMLGVPGHVVKGLIEDFVRDETPDRDEMCGEEEVNTVDFLDCMFTRILLRISHDLLIGDEIFKLLNGGLANWRLEPNAWERMKHLHAAVTIIMGSNLNDEQIKGALSHAFQRTADVEDFTDHLRTAIRIVDESGTEGLRTFEKSVLQWGL